MITISGEFMTNQQILEKATRKAIDGGWKTYIVSTTGDPKLLAPAIVSQCNWAEIIFNHDFAKSFWKDATLTKGDIYLDSLWSGYDEYPSFDGEPWQFHLQQMVIAPDPIAYLGEHLGG